MSLDRCSGSWIAAQSVVVHVPKMTGNSTFQDFLAQTVREFGTVPKRGLIYAVTAGTLSAIAGLLDWGMDTKFAGVNYIVPVFVSVCWLSAAYATTMAMIERPSSITGFFKFAAVTIFMFMPFLCGLAVLAYAAGAHDGWTISTVILLFIFGFICSSLLPAWPVTQAISEELISPARIVKATKGYRWSLILVFFAAGSVNKLMPEISDATNAGEAIALALCGAVVAAAILVLTASIAVTAWKFAVRRDASLAYP